MREVLGIVLAGGKGTRLDPLTRDRAKPAVPFGGQYRIIDFTLSNCINSGLRRVLVLTQYKAASLNRHLDLGWQFLSRQLHEYVEVIPPQQRVGESWYLGTADAIYQNIYSIEQANPAEVLVLSGDHVYQMDYRAILRHHRERRAHLTIACQPVPRAEGRDFGILDVDKWGRVTAFREKPADPPPMPDDPDRTLASMGIYVFDTKQMYEQLFLDATREASAHDFGRDIIPAMLADPDIRVHAYPFRDPATGTPCYWRDVGTLDAYFEAHLDLIGRAPPIDLYDPDWPTFTLMPIQPPPKIVAEEPPPPPINGRGPTDTQVGSVKDAILCPGVIIAGARVRRSVLSPRVEVHGGANVEEAILLDQVRVGPGATVRRAIIDKGVRIPPGVRIGVDPDLDRRRGLIVSPGGITVVPRGEELERIDAEESA